MNDELTRDFKGIWIPKEIWLDSRLNTIDKIYLSIYKEYKDIKMCDEIMLYSISKTRIIKTKNKLDRLKYITKRTLNSEELKEKTILLSHKGKKCEWCKKETYILHKHHYPIPQKKGGREIVNICPNCHYTFHTLEENYYE